MREPAVIEVFTPHQIRKPNLAQGRTIVLKPIETFYRKEGDCFGPEEKRSVTLSGEHEVEDLLGLIVVNRTGATSQNDRFLLVDAQGGAADVLRLLKDLNASGKADALATLLCEAVKRPEL